MAGPQHLSPTNLAQNILVKDRQSEGKKDNKSPPQNIHSCNSFRLLTTLLLFLSIIVLSTPPGIIQPAAVKTHTAIPFINRLFARLLSLSSGCPGQPGGHVTPEVQPRRNSSTRDSHLEDHNTYY